METPDAEDPFDWNVDQVVAALCNPRAAWTKSTSFNPLPEPNRFEQALRENRIDGCMLLTQLDHASARDDLGLKALGERGTIMHAVRSLRARSQKYNEYIQEIASQIPLPGSSVWTNPGVLSHHGFGSPLYGSPAFTVPAVPSIQSGPRPSPIMSPTRSATLMEASNIPQAKPGYNTWSEAFTHTPKLARPDERRFLEEPRQDAPESPLSANETQQTLSPVQTPTAKLLDADELRSKEGPDVINAMSQSQVADHNHRAGETYIIDESGKKRRKLTLVPVHSNLDIHGPENAGSDAEEKSSRPTSLKAGQVTIDLNGRKRMKPILISQPAVEISNGTSTTPDASPSSPQHTLSHVQEAEEVDAHKPMRESSRGPRFRYLGLKAYPVDDIFYSKTMLGEEVQNDVSYGSNSTEIQHYSESETFLVANPSHLPDGQRLYVHGLMKHFLAASERRDFNHNGQSLTAIFPYPERIGRKHLNPSFTLFSHMPSGIRATREDRTKWSAAYQTIAPRNISQIDQDSPVTHFSVPQDDPFSLTESQNENHDWDFLEKWRYVDQGEKVLPIYGDSGSEGEYDLDTWREIEDERGTIERPVGRSSGKHLTRDEVSDAINQGIADLGVKWRTQILPLKESKAWRLWTKSRRDRSKYQQIEIATARIIYLSEVRLPKMRKEITSEVWSNVVQVKRQCRILEETIFELEDQKWRISTLQLKSTPPKPSVKGSARPVKVPSAHDSLGDDDEILESEPETGQSSDDGLDGFIIDDDNDAQAGLAGVADQLISETDRVQDGDDEEIRGVDNNTTSSEDDIVTSTLRRRQQERGEQSPSTKLEGTSHSRLTSDSESLGTLGLHLGQPEPSSILSSARTVPDPFISTPLVARDRRKPIILETVIDLTISSDLPEAPSPEYKSDPYLNIRTPPLNPRDANPFRDVNKPRIEFRDPPMHSSVINLESGSSPTLEEDTVLERPDELPDLSDVEAISRLKPSFLVERQDRKRLLIWYIHRLSSHDRLGLVARTIAATLEESQIDVWNGLQAIKEHKRRLRGAQTRTSDDIMRLSQFYICWSQNLKYSLEGYPQKYVEKTIEDEAGFECFYTFLCDRLAKYENDIVEDPVVIESTPEKSIRGLGKRKLGGSFAARLRQDESDDLFGERTPHKKRKNVVQESVEARHIRSNDRQRVQDQERRRTQLMRFQQTIMRDGEVPLMIINVSKFEHQDLIHLNTGIATKIKPHQLEGVQFMWRELVTDERSLQGCLLAHTMGLGKTMQVIALLVTIAESAKSQNHNIQDQVPLGLHESRTLILCPPSLVDNWWDEFLIWTPVPMEDNVGQLRKVVSGSRSGERLHEITAWYNDGGVLIISYDLFRHYVHNKSTKSRGPPLNEEQHAKVRKELLEGPNIIVADEAHKMKNISSATTSAANQFRSKSRIALTGSPLANNLEEYYAMINWIAPGYLGDIVQFRARYVEPIQEGLYQNSSAREKRECLKMLQVLKRDLDPKINRADITVLKGSLKAKTEFVIKVPLTKLQEDAYRLYVRSMLGDTGDNEPGNARLWDWLAILSLLCNHPLCFKNKLLEREAAAQQSEAATIKARQRVAHEGVVNSEDELLPGDEVVSKLGVSQATIEKQLSLLDNVPVALDSISHSHKVEIFNRILDASIAADDKVLVFSHSIPTLNYLENLFKQTGRRYARLDGKTKMSDRQKLTKDFNSGKAHVCLISTRAGGLGLNLPGANRVIIFDFGFNPIWEEQAVGRAYRIGQEKPVFVYRFTAGGTFEDKLHNQAVFKTQLASRVVDKKNPMRFAIKGVRQYLFEPKSVVQKDLSSFLGKDPLVLDGILASENSIRSIELTETFHQEDNDKLTAEEEKEAEQILKDEQLKRTNPAAYRAIVSARDHPHSMFSRFHTGKAPAMPMAQSHSQSPSQPLMTLQNPLLTKANQAIKTSAAKILSDTLGYPNLPPVAGASAKSNGHVFGATGYTTLARNSSPHPSLSAHPVESYPMEPMFPAEGREGTHTSMPAQSAKPPHSSSILEQLERPANVRSTYLAALPRNEPSPRSPDAGLQTPLLETLQTNDPSESGTHMQIPSRPTVITPPSKIRPLPAGAPSPSSPVDWVTESELLANIPPEGIKPNQLIPTFRGRIRDEEELLDWITACAKWDPSTNILWPREPSQRDRSKRPD